MRVELKKGNASRNAKAMRREVVLSAVLMDGVKMSDTQAETEGDILLIGNHSGFN